MQTLLQIPDSLLEEVSHYISLENQSEAITKIIREWIRYKKIQELKQLRGQIKFEGDLTALREMEKHDSY